MPDEGSHCSATCQHRMGRYVWLPPCTDTGDVQWCGKPATHVAEYPGKPPSYFCRKHAKSRHFVRELPMKGVVIRQLGANYWTAYDNSSGRNDREGYGKTQDEAIADFKRKCSLVEEEEGR